MLSFAVFDIYVFDFFRIDDFEFTSECAIFELLDIPPLVPNLFFVTPFSNGMPPQKGRKLPLVIARHTIVTKVQNYK